MLTTVQIETTDYKCDVCGDKSCNWYYGAIVCEACKKFFVRSQTESREEYNCERFLRLSKYCVINIETRRDCKFCRYQKCLKVGLDLQIKSSDLGMKDLVDNSVCTVCSGPSTGIHFGVMTCEACKGFFRRSNHNNNYKKYRCLIEKNCKITSTSRNCRYCRFQKCRDVGMSMNGARTGRKPNIVKQQMILTSNAEKRANSEDSLETAILSSHSKRARSNAEEATDPENSVDVFSSSSNDSYSTDSVRRVETDLRQQSEHQLKLAFNVYNDYYHYQQPLDMNALFYHQTSQDYINSAFSSNSPNPFSYSPQMLTYDISNIPSFQYQPNQSVNISIGN